MVTLNDFQNWVTDLSGDEALARIEERRQSRSIPKPKVGARKRFAKLLERFFGLAAEDQAEFIRRAEEVET